MTRPRPHLTAGLWLSIYLYAAVVYAQTGLLASAGVVALGIVVGDGKAFGAKLPKPERLRVLPSHRAMVLWALVLPAVFLAGWAWGHYNAERKAVCALVEFRGATIPTCTYGQDLPPEVLVR